MSTTNTSDDIRFQVQQAVGASDGEYDVDGIVRTIIDQYGLISVERIDHDNFWTIVVDHTL